MKERSALYHQLFFLELAICFELRSIRYSFFFSYSAAVHNSGATLQNFLFS